MASRVRRSAIFGLVAALYVIALAVTPALHCDFECHQKAPTHCLACVAAPVAAPPVAVLHVDAAALPLVGEAPAPAVAPLCRAVVVDVPGRAPPA